MRALLFTIALAWLGAANAMPTLEWSADVGSGAVADDNWLFSEDEISSAGLEASIAGSAKLVAPTSEITVRGNALKTEFESSELPGAEDWGVSLDVAREHRLGASTVAIGYRSRDTLLGVNDTVATTAKNEEERTAWVVANSVRELGARSAASISASASQVRYASPTPDRNDFEFGTVAVGWDYEVGPTLVSSVRLLVDAYQTEEIDLLLLGRPFGSQRTQALAVGPGLVAGWEMNAQCRVNAEVSVQRRWNSTELELSLPGFPTRRESSETDTVEYLGELGFTRHFERGVLHLGVRRNLSPSSLGQLLTRDTGNAYASRELTPTSSLSLSASIVSEEDDTSFASNRRADRTKSIWVNAEVAYAHGFGPNLAVVATYRYRTQQQQDADSLDSNGVFVRMTYRMGNTQ